MGCCISKCRPKRQPLVNPNVQDKLVISQSPPSPPPSPPRKRKTVQPPPSVTSASFTCSTQSTTCGNSSSLSSASSCSSSVTLNKLDRSFSNEFLQSCAKENPQIIGLDPVKKIGEVKQTVPGTTTQKRARASSPTLTRQKSFRVEKDKSLNINGRSMVMRSPSPSRRFNDYTSNNQRPLPSMVFSTNTRNESSRSVKASTRPASPSRSNERVMYSKNKERFGYESGSKVEGVEVAKVLSKVNYLGPVAIEDIDNPHIALDCFIFL